MPTNTRAEAFAPASMGNVGVGFDILGLAFEEPGDTVLVEVCDRPGIVIRAIEGDAGVLSLNPKMNTAAIAADTVLKTVGAEVGITMTIKKGLPIASGLGSSAGSAVAGAVAVNALLGEPLTREELLPACLDGEAAVSGRHLDNVGPSLFGGITLITGTEAASIRRLPVPENMHLAVVTPDVTVSTAAARAVLPQAVPLSMLTAQTGAVARLIDALHRQDVYDAAIAMEQDGIIEPARAHLMPMLAQVRSTAKRAGALALVISGAGPTLCAVCDAEDVARKVAAAMQEVYIEEGIRAVSRATRVNHQGAYIVDVR